MTQQSVVLFCLLSVAMGASIGRIAQNIHSDAVFLDAGLDTSSGSNGEFKIRPNTLPVGGSVDLYYRYGFFSLSVRVIPRDDPGAWLIREPTTGIFEPTTVQTRVQPGPNSFAKQPFEISLCDDIEELKEAYFRNFKAEGIAQPHKLYTGSWRTAAKVRAGDADSVLDFVQTYGSHYIQSVTVGDA